VLNGYTSNPGMLVLRSGLEVGMPGRLISRRVIRLCFLIILVCQFALFLLFTRSRNPIFYGSEILSSLLGHYVENTHPTETLRYIEMFQADTVKDFGLEQWLALTPPDLVAQILNVSIETVKGFRGERGVLVMGKE
jgi:hypothetical protein